MAGGRPTKLTPEVMATAADYAVNFADYDDLIPTIAGLAGELKVSRETVHAWSREGGNPEFSDIVKDLMGNQERKLVNGSLGNQLNPMIAKLMLSKHGYSDKQEIDHQSSDGTMSPKAYSKEQYDKAESAIDDKVGDLD